MTLDLDLGPNPLAMDSAGTVRVGGSRVTLDTLIRVFKQGEAAEQIQYDFPTLDLADIYLALGYYLRHQHEVDVYLEERARVAEALRREIEAQADTPALRERMQALREKRARVP